IHCMHFFFSSRRRHTRFDCDWSSDVCSSDLVAVTGPGAYAFIREEEKALHRIADVLKTPLVNLEKRVQSLLEERRALEKRVEERSEERRVGKESSGGWEQWR